MKKALITGITGQDGSYLAELLLDKGYEVHGVVHDLELSEAMRTSNLRAALKKKRDGLHLHFGDLADAPSIERVLRIVRPDEIYNLGAQSHVRVSFDLPEHTANVTGTGPLRILEAMRRLELPARFYQASSSEMFGKVHETPQSETTPFHPRSPYAVAKVFAYYAALNYREAYGTFAVNGILFNHESERRGEMFVTRKITRAVGRIKAGLQRDLVLGNVDAKRDWGHAADYVRAMWMMLQANEPDDFVVATGETHTVREFLELAFARVGLSWQEFVRTDEKFLRPSEVDLLLGDASKAHEKLGWKPEIDFPTLVHRMVDHDLELAEREKHELS
jgi:GDPmannose 4,6-dehydratase